MLRSSLARFLDLRKNLFVNLIYYFFVQIYFRTLKGFSYAVLLSMCCLLFVCCCSFLATALIAYHACRYLSRTFFYLFFSVFLLTIKISLVSLTLLSVIVNIFFLFKITFFFLFFTPSLKCFCIIAHLFIFVNAFFIIFLFFIFKQFPHLISSIFKRPYRIP
jgi:hypothetical protein